MFARYCSGGADHAAMYELNARKTRATTCSRRHIFATCRTREQRHHSTMAPAIWHSQPPRGCVNTWQAK
jgi:hypothetical protein